MNLPLFHPAHPKDHPIAPPPSSTWAAVRFWEMGRIWYNLALATVCGVFAWRTWPAFRPEVVLPHLHELIGLAAIANLLYSAAYLVEFTFHESRGWRKHRWILLVAGILLGMLITQYWVGDEIYPSVAGHA